MLLNKSFLSRITCSKERSRTRRCDLWTGWNARHGVALPYNYWTPAQWHGAFDKLRVTGNNLGIEPKANPFPTDLIFGRSLHFIAALRVPTNAGGN